MEREHVMGLSPVAIHKFLIVLAAEYSEEYILIHGWHF
jgi:hypothetical protein